MYFCLIFRGKCRVQHFQDIVSVKDFKVEKDNYFYVLEYNPKTKRLATTQGEIRVGSSHQVGSIYNGVVFLGGMGAELVTRRGEWKFVG